IERVHRVRRAEEVLTVVALTALTVFQKLNDQLLRMVCRRSTYVSGPLGRLVITVVLDLVPIESKTLSEILVLNLVRDRNEIIETKLSTFRVRLLDLSGFQKPLEAL